MCLKERIKCFLCVLLFSSLVDEGSSSFCKRQQWENGIWTNYYDPDVSYYGPIKTLCQGLTTTNQIDVIDTTGVNQFLENTTFLEIQNSTIPSLNRDFLPPKLPRIRRIYLQEVSLKNISLGAFNGLKLEELRLNGNQLKILAFGVFNSLQYLRVLDLAHNQIGEVEKKSLDALINLKTLYLNDNNIIVIEENIFDNLASLEYLDISRNPIKQIGASELPNLKTFLISELLIQDFRFNFSDVTMAKIDLSNNELTDVDLENVFVSNLNLAGNNLTSIGILSGSHLTELDYSFNKIAQIDKGVFRGFFNLIKLSLASNQIKSLPFATFQDLHHLAVLNLSFNLFEKLQFGTFEGINDLQVLDLSGNKLSTLDSSTIAALTNLDKFYLSKNQIKFFEADIFLQHHPSLKIIALDENLLNCQDLVDIYLKCTKQKAVLLQGNSYEGENFRGISCDYKPQLVSDSSPDNEASFDALSAQFVSSLNKQVDESELKRFFQEDFKTSNFFRYFDEGYKKSQLFKFLSDYQLSVQVKNDNFNESQAGKLTPLQITPVEGKAGNSIQIFIVIILIIIACLMLAGLYVIFNFFKRFENFHKNETCAVMELC